MAESRRKLANDAAWRDNIKTAHVLKKLQNHVFGDVDMTSTQVKAAEILLKKTIPDVQQIQIDVSGGLTVEVLQVASHKPPTKKRASSKAAGK